VCTLFPLSMVTLLGGWTTREVNGPYGSGLWKHIRNGSKTKFWDDVWCGSCSLKHAFPDLYRIARHKDAV
jgi:hypothetical protein